MKLSFFERTITCCLFGAATMAVATGMKKVDPPSEGDSNLVAFEAMPDDEDQLSDEEAAEESDEHSLQRLIDQVSDASKEERSEKRDALKQALAQIFRKRTEAQRQRIAGMRERLEEIESQLEKRSNLEEQIVERRLGELLGESDELSWDHEPSINLDANSKEGRDAELLGREFVFEFPKEFPKEFPQEWATRLDFDKFKAAQNFFQKSRKEAEQAAQRAIEMEKSVRDTNRELQNAEAMARSKGLLDRARAEKERVEKEMRSTERHGLSQEFRSLPRLESLRETLRESKETNGTQLEERVRGTAEETGVLKARIESMQRQSELLKKQLDELIKKKQKGTERL